MRSHLSIRPSYSFTKVTGGPKSSTSPGRIILSVLLEFWLTDVSEPVPSDAPPSQQQQQQQQSPILASAGSSVRYEGPSEEDNQSTAGHQGMWYSTTGRLPVYIWI